jgi:cyclophilin family peptidyl-prolyl cis-trans isomerase
LLLHQLKRTAALLPLLLPLAALTPRGVIVCELEFARAPMTVASFVGLAEGTLGPAPRKPFFNGLTFHRVVPGFVVQGGDPRGTGEGDPGYTFADEFGAGLSHGSVGAMSMANSGPDTNGSQFFITLAPVDRLDFLYSVFGHTVQGADVLPRIVQGDTMAVRIMRVGAAARAFRADDGAFAALTSRAPRYGSETKPSPTAHFDDPDKLLPQDPPSAETFLNKLNNVERATGVRIYARVFTRFAPTGDAPTPQGLADLLARQLHLGENGALAVYFAESKEWRLSIGKALAPRFAHQAKAPERASLEAATERLLFESQLRAQKYAADSAAILPNVLQDKPQQLKFIVGAFLTELIAQLTVK